MAGDAVTALAALLVASHVLSLVLAVLALALAVALAVTVVVALYSMAIGQNPATGLWEFYDLRSAWDGASDPAQLPIPTHRDDGSIAVTDDLGIVFVLLPGGTLPDGIEVLGGTVTKAKVAGQRTVGEDGMKHDLNSFCSDKKRLP